MKVKDVTQELMSAALPDLSKVDEIVPQESVVAPILTQEAVHKHEAKMMSMSEFEAQVQMAKSNGYQWLEVPKETLTMVCNGEYPAEHYICYKDVKVACEGQAQPCMAKEKITTHEKIFPNDKFKVK